jgi:TonB family protein
MMLILIAAILLCGCATLETPGAPDTFPQLIQQEPLPPWPFPATEQEVVLDIKIRIDTNGSVKDVSFLTPILNREWNARALEKIRQWKFSPAFLDGRPVALWIRQRLRMRFEDAAYLRLAEIVCSTQQTADSVYALLNDGASFDSLAAVFSVSDSRTKGGLLGDVDLRTLPLFIRHRLQKLSVNHCSPPLPLGRNYVIFKCLSPGPRNVPPG